MECNGTQHFKFIFFILYNIYKLYFISVGLKPNLHTENNSAEIIIRKNNFCSLDSFELNFGYPYFENNNIEF